MVIYCKKTAKSENETDLAWIMIYTPVWLTKLTLPLLMSQPTTVNWKKENTFLKNNPCRFIMIKSTKKMIEALLSEVIWKSKIVR